MLGPKPTVKEMKREWMLSLSERTEYQRRFDGPGESGLKDATQKTQHPKKVKFCAGAGALRSYRSKDTRR